MSYEPTNWKSGDTVTSAKLNKMEQGIANAGALVVNGSFDAQTHTVTLDKTWQEISNAAPLVWLVGNGPFDPIQSVYEDLGQFVAEFQTAGLFSTDSADGYPASQGGQ